MTHSAVLAIDLGTSSVKSLIVDSEGRVLGRGTSLFPVQRPLPGWAEQRPDDWWRATREAVSFAFLQANRPELAAIGLAGQMHGTVVLDEGYQPLLPAIIWEDQRSTEEIDEITRVVSPSRYQQIAGTAPFPGFQIATLRWLINHEPSTWQLVKHVLLPKDYIRFKLTGEIASDPGDGSGTAMLDVNTRGWSKEITSALDIDRDLLPSLSNSHETTGLLSHSAATELGLRSGIHVVAGTGDAPAAALACGAADSRTMAITISSGSQAIRSTSSPHPDSKGRWHTWCNCLSSETGAGWYHMAATMASGVALRWLRDAILTINSFHADRLLDDLGGQVPAGAGGLVFVPYLTGERTPHMDSSARGAFLGLSISHDRRHMVRAVMEGSVFALHEAATLIDSAAGPASRLVLTGGGSRSRLWTQIVADVFQQPIHVNLEPDGSALGAAILAATGAGWFTAVEGSTSWVRLSDPIEPATANAVIYQALEEIYQGYYEAHKRDFSALGTVLARSAICP